MPRAYLSLGSNLGDRKSTLKGALNQLKRRGIHILQVSSLYETEPQEFVEQPWFLNAVAEIETSLSGETLLDLLKEIEREQGRRRGEGQVPKGPRIIDIDIVLFGDLVVNGPGLTIPHPGMLKRRFVLEPLLEVAPTVAHPKTGEALATYMSDVGAPESHKVRFNGLVAARTTRP